MPKSKLELGFSTHTVRDWEKIALQELGNKNPWQNLTKEKNGLTIKPYYDGQDRHIEKKIALAQANELNPCLNIPKIIAVNEKVANEQALQHLTAGADGIYFDIQTASVHLKALLKNIELPACSVFFSCGNNSPDFLEEFADFANDKNGEVHGVFFWNDDSSANFNWKLFKKWRSFRCAGVHVQEQKNIVDEIVDALCKAVDYLELLIKADLNKEEAFQYLAFSISVQTDFFLSIAKIRALKNLWFVLQEVYQIKNPTPVFIHVDSPVWLNENFQPQGNLLKQTTAAMAAVISGCDALTLQPEDFKNPMMSRIARNVSSILKEESYLSKVTDPLAGSFYVDALTDQIAREAWKKFQLNET